MNFLKYITLKFLAIFTLIVYFIISPYFAKSQENKLKGAVKLEKFKYTGQSQEFIVPDGVLALEVELAGGSGGYAFSKNDIYGFPGLGGRVMGILNVSPGQHLIINVGGIGQNGTEKYKGEGGFSGGAPGGIIANEYAGGGGGGSSDIRIANGTLKDRLIVAGGGGGAGKYGAGGNGGGLQGANGYGDGENASGGSQSKGGLGGIYYNSAFAESGTFGMGGASSAGTTGGGGGGGWYGGGGGAFGDGAGGSSFAAKQIQNVQHSQGTNEGNGYVTIRYIQNEDNSKVLITNKKAKKNLKIFPNPTSGEFNMQLENEEAGKAEISLQLPTGAILLRKTVYLKNAYSLVKYTIPGKIPGIYYITITTTTSKQTGRVVVE